MVTRTAKSGTAQSRSAESGTAKSRLCTVVAATAVLAATAAPSVSATPVRHGHPAPGTVVGSAPLTEDLWVPGTGAAYRLTYTTTDAHGRTARSTGSVFVPKGEAPQGGWPVVSWAHGTVGLDDSCAPSLVGSSAQERDLAYLAKWMEQGYAVVASDYVGLGTKGLMPYLDGRTTAHNVVDMVKAGRNFAEERLPQSARLSREWVTIGQSQGAGAAIYTARHATEFGGAELDYRGAVGTGTPAYVEKLVAAAEPSDEPSSPVTTAYGAYIFAALRDVHPELRINRVLSREGKEFIDRAEKECLRPFEKRIEEAGVSSGDFLDRPVNEIPGFAETVREYMGMPEDGFDQPFFMAHGTKDKDVPISATAAYAAALKANGEPVTFATYPTDHSGTMAASQPDTVPFVRELFAD
ncbi:lipase family protein [Streptomyces boluensis]|uniref:Prolyl oligopeptidase family serine peptidase n=1 Tax=Streptomyces boluensis TaxID=1775135 RepID=A0A964UTW0_9ACTN|nr:lipase family protein [Streptomyces boluensis]NBE55309.1 prolyl oligopeptidase family serine peptidase [Streptomyces boluensis]